MTNTVTHLIGNTLRFNVSFKNWSGDLSDPDNPKLRVYDSNLNLLITTQLVRLALGEYYALWTIPQESNRGRNYIYEISGELENTPSNERGIIKAVFV